MRKLFLNKDRHTREGIFVQGHWNEDNNHITYIGIDLATEQELFNKGPLTGGSYYLSHVLVIAHTLDLLNCQGSTSIIYTKCNRAIEIIDDKDYGFLFANVKKGTELYGLATRCITWLMTTKWEHEIRWLPEDIFKNPARRQPWRRWK